MRKNKAFFGIALLVAVLALGIGYAAVIGNISLNITGSASATVSDENFKVKFDDTVDPTFDKTAVSANSTNVVVTPSLDVDDEHEATLSVSGLTTMNDTVTATYTIVNNSPELSALITAGTITNTNEEYFAVTSVVNTPATVTHGESTTLTVTVRLKKTPITDQTATLTIPFTAEAKVAS